MVTFKHETHQHTAHHYWHNINTPGLLGSYLLVPSGILALGQSLLQNTGFGTHIQKTQQMKNNKNADGPAYATSHSDTSLSTGVGKVVRESAARPPHCATSWSLLVLALHCPTDNINVQQCHNLYPLFLSLPLIFYFIVYTVILFYCSLLLFVLLIIVFCWILPTTCLIVVFTNLRLINIWGTVFAYLLKRLTIC